MRYIDVNQATRVPQFLNVESAGRHYGFVLDGASYHDASQGWDEPRPEHRHASYQVWVFTRGNGRYLLRGAHHRYRRGTLVIPDLNAPHTLAGSSGRGMQAVEMTFSYRDEAGRLLALPLHQVLSLWSGEVLAPVTIPLQLDEARTSRLAELLLMLADSLQPPGLLRLLPAHATVFEIFMTLVRDVYLQSPGYDGAGAADSLLRARAYLDNHYAEAIALEALAAHVNLSRSHFCRAFSQRFGRPPIRYQQEIRMRAARHLLATTQFPVADVASRVGYTNSQYFARLFRAATGDSPRAYRRRLQG